MSNWSTSVFAPSVSARTLGFLHDLSWAALAPLLGIMLRNDFFLLPEEVDGTIVYVTVSFLTAIVIFPLFSMQRDIWEYTSLSDIVRVALAALTGVVLTTFLVFVINRHVGVARSVPLLHYLLLLFPLLTGRVMFRSWYQKRQEELSAIQRDGKAKLALVTEHVLIVGVSRLSELYAKAVRDLSNGNTEIVGIVSDDTQRHGQRLSSHPVLGHIQNLPHFLQEFRVRGISIEKIVVCISWEKVRPASQVMLNKVAEEEDIQIEFVDKLLGITGSPTGRASAVAKNAEKRLLVSNPVNLSGYFKVKRVFDLAVAIPAVVLSAPVMLLLAVMNRIALGDPVLFWQKRPGRNGSNFKVYKFRTMLAPYDDDGKRIEDELRQTSLTRFVRRSKFDELPQLYNILAGHMSLIGPRPLLPKDQPRGSQERLQVPPGVTGWAQVNGGDAITSDEKLALDMWYARHASLWLDLKIVFLTLMVVLRGDQRNDDAVLEATTEFRLRYPYMVEGWNETIASDPTPRIDPPRIDTDYAAAS